ncbi:MAG: disulfide bond formation protein B [Inquilinus sp.]|nr:disulfide bond formation protein B [Inquilinus sp.]
MIANLIEFAFRRAAVLLLIAAMAVLGSALTSQYVGGLQPCVLCLYQRWPYVVVIVLAAIALALPPRARAAALGLAGLALWVGAGIAAFHVGVEQGWWQGTAECGGIDSGADSVDALRAQLLGTPIVRCDVVPWSLFGISMAGYNFLLSIPLGGAVLIAARRLTGESRR